VLIQIDVWVFGRVLQKQNPHGFLVKGWKVRPLDCCLTRSVGGSIRMEVPERWTI
jgi:hypothetical protein